MELAHYLTMASMKRRHHSSWEEKAFAEDFGGIGIVWPPRSYSCSFCHREFRSAQALGGHMNVHRRDRARLKQSSLLVNNPNPNPSLSAAQDSKVEEKDDCVVSSSSSSSSWLVFDDRMGLKRIKVANTKMFSDKKSNEEELDLELRLGNVGKLK